MKDRYKNNLLYIIYVIMGCTSASQISSVHSTNATNAISHTDENSSPHQAVFQILSEYPKVRKVVRESLNPKDVNWGTWSLCFERDIYPPTFLRQSSEKRITQDRVAVFLSPIWYNNMNMIFLYRNEKNNMTTTHISIPASLMSGPIEMTTIEREVELDKKISKILVTRSWYFLLER